jgi:hypothetical protein
MKYLTWLRLKFIAILQKTLKGQMSNFNKAEYDARVQSVKEFFLDTLPTIGNEAWKTRTVYFGNISCNTFPIPHAEYPTYQILVPEVPLYVCVRDIKSASWPYAQDRGVTRQEWEMEQGDIQTILDETEQIATITEAVSPKILMIKWEDSINHFHLKSLVDSL